MPINYYTCSNQDLELDQPPNARSELPYLEMMSIFLHVLIRLRIKWFNKKEKIKVDPKPKIWMTTKSLTLSQIESQSLADFTTNVFGLSLCSLYTFFAKSINSMTITELNMSPNNVFMNIFQLICPCLISCFISVVYYYKHPLLRKTMLRELRNCFSSG